MVKGYVHIICTLDGCVSRCMKRSVQKCASNVKQQYIVVHMLENAVLCYKERRSQSTVIFKI